MVQAAYGSRGNFGDEVFKWYRSKMAKVEKGTEKILQEAGAEGERLMKEYIATRGTAKSGKQGRIDTRAMYNAVGNRILGRGGSQQVRFGWVSGTRKDYFAYQETGFEHKGGVTVEGMYALSDAADKVLRDLEKNLRGVMKNA